MRYALIILAFFFCTIKTEAQVYQAMPQAGYGPVKRMLVDSVLTIPIGISQLRNITGGRDTAQIRYQKSDSSVYVYTGSSWVKLGSGGGGGGGSADSTVFFTVYRADTMRANIYGAIPQPDTLFAIYPIRISNDSIYLAQTFVDSVGTGGGGGAGTINYYLNGSVSQGTFGGTTYYQLSQNPIFGAGTNFTRTNAEGNGYIASFITDANDPNVLGIPGGNWNLEFYFNSNSSGGSPQFYAEVYKYDGSTFTLLASGSTNPETITNGTTVDQYFTSIPVPTATLLATDRIAVRVYVITGGRNITLHTENSNLSEVLTTLTIPAWKTNGNSDINAGKFLGSTNNASVRFRTNNVERMVLDSIGALKMASVANNGTLNNALQLANTDNRSFFNISTSTNVTNLTLKANNNAVGDSMVISDSGLIAPRNNATLWLKPTQSGNNNVVANRCAGCGSGSIFSANVGTSAPIFNMLSTGQMAINGETPASTAALDITSTSRGLLIPRMTTSQRNAISSPATGLMVWNTDDTTLNQYTGNTWRGMVSTNPNGVINYTAPTQTGSSANGAVAITQTQNTTGAVHNFDINITNTASGSSSSLFRVRKGGTNQFNIATSDGTATFVNDVGLSNTNGIIFWSSSSQIRNTSNGIIRFSAASGGAMTRIQFGGTTSSSPGLAMSSADLIVQDASGGTATRFGVGVTPNSALTTTSMSTAYTAQTANYTATSTDYTINCTANTFQVTLPTAVGITGRIYTIVNSGAGTITIGTTSSQTFANVVTTPTTLTMATVGTRIVQSNGANWLLISSL
jgi:hypothetical protein